MSNYLLVVGNILENISMRKFHCSFLIPHSPFLIAHYSLLI